MKQTIIMVLWIMLALMTMLIPGTALCSSEPDEALDVATASEPIWIPGTISPHATPTDLNSASREPQDDSMPIYVLPATGGTGVGWYGTGGMALLLAGGMLMRKWRRS